MRYKVCCECKFNRLMMLLKLVLLNLSNVFLEIILLLRCKTLSYAKWLNSSILIYHVIKVETLIINTPNDCNTWWLMNGMREKYAID